MDTRCPTTHRRIIDMIEKPGRYAVLMVVLSLLLPVAADAQGLANGIKIGEVTDTSAIVWLRVTEDLERVRDYGPVTDDHPPSAAEGELPGSPAWVQIHYSTYTDDGCLRRTTRRRAVWRSRDYTQQFMLTDLLPDAVYGVVVSIAPVAADPAGALAWEPKLAGEFRTAPLPDRPAQVRFTVTTGQQYWHQDSPDGFAAYASMAALDPSLFVHTGDIIYYDKPDPIATSTELARHHWHRMYSMRSLVEFHRGVPSYFIKDDHDTYHDDCWPGMVQEKMGSFSFEEGQRIFHEQVPMGESTYRTVRWGEDLQIWLVEGRDFRSSNTDPDGPGKTILGAEQIAWLRATVLESDATFKVLFSATPIVGPDREGKRDNHSNANFQHEGAALREWITDNAPEMVVVCGDRHWQYVSADPETGLREYSCGPISDIHAGGFSGPIDEYHDYFNVTGGFLSGTVERVDGVPTLTFRHHAVDGAVLNEDTLTVEP